MALINILSDVASIAGIKITNSAERAWLIDEINNSAKELHNSQDLLWSDREQIFNVGMTDQLIALPFYVDKVIYAREYDTQIKVEIQDMRPRYRTKDWNPPYLRWRVRDRSALCKDIVNIGPLTLTLSKESAESFNVIVTGSTALSQRISEVINFAVGDLTKTTTNLFTEIESIHKSATTTYDLTVSDCDSNIISVVPNSETHSIYTIVQVLDKWNMQPIQDRLVEVLYKVRFTPFVSDYDQFPCSDIYDHAILWDTLAHIWSTMDGAIDKAAAAETNKNKIVADIDANYQSCNVQRPDAEQNPFFGLFGSNYRNTTNRPVWPIGKYQY